MMKQKAKNLKMDVKESELFPDNIGNFLEEFDKRDKQLNKVSSVFVKFKPSYATKRLYFDRFGNTSFKPAYKSRK